MISKWYEYKPEARRLRNNGLSIKDIHKKLGIPLSTLSGWLKDVKLNKNQRAKLEKKWRQALVDARVKAVLWHNEQKKFRIEQAQTQAKTTLSQIDITDKNILDLTLALLYLGEGSKKTLGTSMGNSDPQILKFFITILKYNYAIDNKNIKCELHLRADQDPNKIRKYWSKELHLSIKNFMTISIDERTSGKPTYHSYKGVCVVRCGNVAIQRKLVYLSKIFCEKVIENGRLAQLVRASD